MIQATNANASLATAKDTTNSDTLNVSAANNCCHFRLKNINQDKKMNIVNSI